MHRGPSGGRHPLMVHGHASDTDSSCRQFYSTNAANTQDFLLGVASDGSVILWQVERMGNQPRSYPNSYVRATFVRRVAPAMGGGRRERGERRLTHEPLVVWDVWDA